MLITVREAAELLKVTEQTAYAWARGNVIPGVLRIGRTIRIEDEEIRAFIKRGGNRSLVHADFQGFSVPLQPAKSDAEPSPSNETGGPIRLGMSPKA